jgi:opacity protein-like surface antigen
MLAGNNNKCYYKRICFENRPDFYKETDPMKKMLLIAALGALFASSTASATDSTDFYGRLGMNASSISMDTSGFSQFERRGTGGTLAVGRTITPHIAVEAGMTTYGNRTVAMQSGDMAWKGRARASEIGLHAVLNYPVTPAVTVFAKPGIVKTRFSSSLLDPRISNRDKTRFDLGIGAEYAVTPEIGVFAAVNRITNYAGSGAKLTATTIGVRLHH